MQNKNLTTKDLQSVYFTTDINNILSIFRNGLLSRAAVLEQELYVSRNDISNPKIQNIRKNKTFASPRSGVVRKLHNYVNVYIQPYNAFLMAVQKEKSRDALCVIKIKANILQDYETAVILTDKNAAAHTAKFFQPKSWALSPSKAKALTSDRLSGLGSTVWVGRYRFYQNKQSRQSEVLIPDKIDARYFDTIYVHNDRVKQELINILSEQGITSLQVIVHKTLFPSPTKGAFSKKLSLDIDPDNLSRLSSLFEAEYGAATSAIPTSPQNDDNSEEPLAKKPKIS